MNIYFLEANEAIKIGISGSTKQRIKQLQVANSDKIKIHYIIEDVPRTFEKHVHTICQKYHIRGEWYKKEVLEEHLLQHPWYKKYMIKV